MPCVASISIDLGYPADLLGTLAAGSSLCRCVLSRPMSFFCLYLAYKRSTVRRRNLCVRCVTRDNAKVSVPRMVNLAQLGASG
jgi:hypothetical protein